MSLGDFLTGFNKQELSDNGTIGGALNDIAQRRQNKLLLQLKSALIEQEMNAKAQNEAQKFQAEGYAGTDMSNLVRQKLGLTTSDTPLTEKDMVAGLHLLGTDGTGNSLQFLPTQDEFGNKSYLPVSKKTGKAVGNAVDAGRATFAAKSISDAKAKYYSAHAQLQDIRNTIQKNWGATSAADIPAQYASMTLNQLTQSRPDLKALFDDMQARALRIDKDLTGTSRFAKEIVDSTTHGLPLKSDTLQTALAKLDNYDTLFNRVKQGAELAFNTKFDADRGSGMSLNIDAIRAHARQFQAERAGKTQGK